MNKRLRRVGVLTAGAGNPALNACVRAVVRMGIYYNLEPWGIREGYAGLLNGKFVQLSSRSVSHIIDKGGTFLGTSEGEAFAGRPELREALRNLHAMGIDGLIVIGDEKSLEGGHILAETGFPAVGVPADVENDILGTTMALGVDTALNTALEAIDHIKDMASAREQAFLVETVGGTGYMALMVGIADGAEVICTPKVPLDLEEIVQHVADAYVRGKRYCLITVAQGMEPDAATITDYIEDHKEETGFGARLSVLGYIQRGGSPTAKDRLLATRLGAAAVETLHEGKSGVMVGYIDGQIEISPLAEILEGKPEINEEYYTLAQILAR
ncbi:MAG: ATP-dependent 6-phosphofructokinase [Anaerolineales bacterium]